MVADFSLSGGASFTVNGATPPTDLGLVVAKVPDVPTS
jgi:hypothetical protein